MYRKQNKEPEHGNIRNFNGNWVIVRDWVDETRFSMEEFDSLQHQNYLNSTANEKLELSKKLWKLFKASSHKLDYDEFDEEEYDENDIVIFTVKQGYYVLNK